MADRMSGRILKWTPRVLSVAITFAFGLLATDAFHQAGNNIIQFGDFLTHLLPSLLMVGASFAAWYWPGWGGLAILLLGASYLATTGGQVEPQAHLIITLPLVVCGGLFVLSAWWRKKK
jgi:hypothetical protein